jgi:hypothetical protein
MSRKARVISGLVFISILIQAILPVGFSQQTGSVYAQSSNGRSFEVPPGRASRLEHEGATMLPWDPAGVIAYSLTI